MNNPLISFFAGSIANINPTKDIDIAEFLNQIKYGKYRKETEAITAISDNKERQAAKAKSLPYVTISGTFTKRNTGGLNTHSGLIAVDIDKIETPAELASVKAALVADVYTHSLFTSVSGRGLCVLVRITNKPENHLNHFLWLEKYYDETFGYQIDTACKDITRPRYFSYDPDVYINPNNSKIAGKKAEPKKQPKSVQSVPTDDKIGRIVTELQDGGHNIAESYEDYTTVAFALANGCGEAGRDFFHIVCQMSSKYDPKKCDRKFTNALDTGAGKVGIGTFLFMCKEVGIEINTPEEKRAFAIAKTAKRSNSDIQGAVQQAEALGVDPKLVKEIAESVFADDSIDLKDDKAPIIERIGIFVKMNTTLRRNLVTRNIEDENGKEFDNVILNSIYIKAKSVIGDEVRKSDVDAFIMSDQTKDFHPIKEWRKDHDHLPHKPEIIDELIDLLPFKEPDAKGFVRSWLLGLPATANGDTVRIVLSLIGGQETGKTEWFRKLLPTSLKRYFAESNLMIDKDTDQVMSSRWIVLDDEMGGKSKKDSQKFKELTSKEEFTLREPYGRGQVTLKRLALLCGTTNDFQVISDSTGNTRILPVEITKPYDFKAHNEIDKDQFLIEIFRAYERGESWKLTPPSKVLLQSLSTDYSVMDIEGELLDKYFGIPESSLDEVFMTATDIVMYLEKISGHKFHSTAKLGVKLKQRFEPKAKKIDKISRRGYLVRYLAEGAYNPNDGGQVTEDQEDTDDLPF